MNKDNNISKKQYFGTDGIRCRVGQYPITPEFMLKLGWAIGRLFSRHGECRVLIGKDTRISGYMFESALEAGLSSAGADVLLLGPMPTPGIAYLTRTFHAEAGIVISASHNPYYDNGIKIFSGQGTKLPDNLELMIEDFLTKELQVVESANLGKVSRINDAAGRYIEFCKSSVPPSTDFNGLKLVLDCANGATYKIAPNVFHELGATIYVVGVSPNGLNINYKCGSTYLKTLQKKVIKEQADLGIAFDGDGDRVMMVSHNGSIVDGDDLLFLIARDMQQIGCLQGGVVGTLMSNLGLELALKEINIPFVRAKVGDRYVISELLARNWKLGGESSGHLICYQHTTTGDAIIAALQVLIALKRCSKTLLEACSIIKKYPQVLVNVSCKGTINPIEHYSVKTAINTINKYMSGKGRILLRKSGTEPLVRIMVEGEDYDQVKKYAKMLAQTVSDLC